MQVVKNPLASAGDTRVEGSVPGLGRSPGVGNGNPLQYVTKKKQFQICVYWVSKWVVFSTIIRFEFQGYLIPL